MAFWAVVVAALTVPNPIDAPPGWLDGSWQVGLDLASRYHLPMGSRLLFSYGPYGFLDFNVPYFADRWLRAVVACLVLHAGFVIAVALLLRRMRAGRLVLGMTTVVLVIALPSLAIPDIEGALLAAMLGLLALNAQRRRGAIVASGAAGVVLALVLLIKGSGIVIVAGELPLLVVSALLGRRRDIALALPSGFAAAFSVLWWGAGMGAADLPRWLHNSLEQASGYTSAMYFGGHTVALFAAMATMVLFAALALVAAIRRRRLAATWLLLCVLLDFAAFKDAFVRDGPVRDAIYFGEVAVLAAVAMAVVLHGRSWRPWRAWPTAPAVVLAAMLALGLVQRLSLPFDASRISTALRGWVTVAHTLVSADARRNVEAPVQASAAAYYGGYIVAAKLPPGATVDFYGLDVGFFYADHSVVWSPRANLVSYQAYTPWLDQQDAAFYVGPGAPQYVIFRNVAIDGRAAPFDEPAMFRALMGHYRYLRTIDGQTVVLRRATGAGGGGRVRSEGRVCAPIGQPIAVPQVTGRRVFGSLVMDESLRGRVVDLGLKPAEVRVTLQTVAGAADYRLIWRTARDGLYLSTRIDDANGLRQVFGPAPGGNAITGLTVSTVAPREWKAPICVDYTSLEPSAAPSSGAG